MCVYVINSAAILFGAVGRSNYFKIDTLSNARQIIFPGILNIDKVICPEYNEHAPARVCAVSAKREQTRL